MLKECCRIFWKFKILWEKQIYAEILYQGSLIPLLFLQMIHWINQTDFCHIHIFAIFFLHPFMHSSKFKFLPYSFYIFKGKMLKSRSHTVSQNVERKSWGFFSRISMGPRGVLRFELDRGMPLEPQNPYLSLRVILQKRVPIFLGFHKRVFPRQFMVGLENIFIEATTDFYHLETSVLYVLTC